MFSIVSSIFPVLFGSVFISKVLAVDSIVVEDFHNPIHIWVAKNDPIMGGKSYATVTLNNDFVTFTGEVVNVPFLEVPGFITMATSDHVEAYPDVSMCDGLKLTLRSSGMDEEYLGYRISFGNVHVPGGRFAFGYKANFHVPTLGDHFQDVTIPFRDFTAKWDDATGGPIVTCEEDSRYCPTIRALQNLKTISIWGEGVAGKIHLDIMTIKAIGCKDPTIDDDKPIPLPLPEIELESFENMKHSWECLNDPVMGGKSTSNLSFENGVANFNGNVAIVPFLHAPGFITFRSLVGSYPDISTCTAMKIVLFTTIQYDGYRISFGTIHLPNGHHATGYKANLKVPLGSFEEVVIPFKDFTSRWDDASGDPIVTCSEDPTYCPDLETLQNIKTISIWAEGVVGEVDLKIMSITAEGCGSLPMQELTWRQSKTESTSHFHLIVATIACMGLIVVFSVIIISRRRLSNYEAISEV
jgi:Complex I intermediate-associated protein 30 (CIA30)